MIVTIFGYNKQFRQNKIEKLGFLTKLDIIGKFKHDKAELGMIDTKIINLMDKNFSHLHSTNFVSKGKIRLFGYQKNYVIKNNNSSINLHYSCETYVNQAKICLFKQKKKKKIM